MAVIVLLRLEEHIGHSEMQLVRGHCMEASLKEMRTLYPGYSQHYWTQAEHQFLDQEKKKFFLCFSTKIEEPPFLFFSPIV